MDETQLEGLKRIGVLDYGCSRISLLEELCSSKSQKPSTNPGNHDYWHSPQFALKLSAPSISFDLPDV